MTKQEIISDVLKFLTCYPKVSGKDDKADSLRFKIGGELVPRGRVLGDKDFRCPACGTVSKAKSGPTHPVCVVTFRCSRCGLKRKGDGYCLTWALGELEKELKRN